jgi:hypothetical protein
MSAPLPPLAQVALNQYHLRVRYWQRRRAAGHCSADEANAQMYPWLALALLCGTDPAQMHLQLAMQVKGYRGGALDLSHGQAAALVAEDYCPRAEALAVLAHARDAALDAMAETKFPDSAQAGRAADNAADLARMARALHAPAYAGTAFIRKEAA